MTGKIKLNATSGGGSVSFQAPSSTGDDRVITLPTTADGTVLTTTNPKSGNIIQVQHGHVTGKSTVSNNGFVLMQTCPVTITPSSSNSKILVSVYTRISRTGNNGNVRVKLYRDISGGATGTDLTASSEVCWFAHWNDYNHHTGDSVGKTHIDTTHSTTAAITYKLYGDSESTNITGAIGGRAPDTYHNCGTDWILMEVAA